MKVLTLGGATEDIFIEYEAQTLQLETSAGTQSYLILEEGKKIEVQNIHCTTGGGATNSAVSFKRLGFDVSVFCKIGNDEAGERVVADLLGKQITTDLIVRDPKHTTGISFIVPSKSGNKTVLALHGANSYIADQELPLKAISQSDLLYITPLNGESAHHLEEIVRQAKKHGALVAIDPGKDQLTIGVSTLWNALVHIDMLILNHSEAAFLMNSLETTESSADEKYSANATPCMHKPALLQEKCANKSRCFNLTDFFKKILAQGTKIVAVTDGAQGVYTATGDNIFFHPSLPCAVVNTVGAGDAFGSCFVASIAEGKTVQEAMVRGIINSSSVIGSTDAQEGLLTSTELDKQSAERTLMQTFPLER